MRKSKFRVLTSIIVASSMLLSPIISVAAESTDMLSGIDQHQIADSEMQYYNAEPVELEPEQIDEQIESGTVEHDIYLESLDLDEPEDELDEEESDNTDPNYALSIANNNTYYGSIAANNEFRWYTFSTSALSKVTVYLEMSENLDADLYLFAYNSEETSLELYDGSATEGTGSSEYLATVVPQGTYYLGISGYDSSGNFAFLYYISSADAANEVNDDANSATQIGFESMSGVIDSPYDLDYYAITLETPAIIKYGITSTPGYALQYVGYDGTGAGLSTVDSSNGYIKANAGTYYFGITATEVTGYSSTQTYTVTFSKIANISPNSSLHIVGICEAAGIVYQADSNMAVNYVNGNLIDISYSYVANLSNSAGLQTYSIILDPNEAYFVLNTEDYYPKVVSYLGSTKPAIQVSNRPVLRLTYYGSNNFYKIHCYGTGAYSGNTFNGNLNNATVIIDPETGRLIDIEYFNYYYDYAPVGNNSITLVNSYHMTLY